MLYKSSFTASSQRQSQFLCNFLGCELLGRPCVRAFLRQCSYVGNTPLMAELELKWSYIGAELDLNWR